MELLDGKGLHKVYDTRGVLTHWYFEKRKRSGLDQGFKVWEVVGTKWGKRIQE